MLWKIYFWVILFLSIIGIVFGYGRLDVWSAGVWFEIITSILALVAIYAYSYGKEVLSPKFWIVFFWITIASWVFSLLYQFTPLHDVITVPTWLESGAVTDGSELLLGIILAAPMAYAIYKLGKKST